MYMYKTIPVFREIEIGKSEVKISLRTNQEYQIKEVVVRPSAVEVKLVKGDDVIRSEFVVPTTVDSSSLSADWSHEVDGDLVVLTLSRALKTLPGLHPRRKIRRQNHGRTSALSTVKLIAG